MAWKQPTEEEMAEIKEKWAREEMEPTPLPWRVVRSKQWDDKDELVAIYGANDDTVADNMEFYPHAIKNGDAELIVRAVNAHDALVAALGRMVAERHEPSCEAVHQAREALALARKGSS